jgi:thiol:disulfide interchange protein/DsbC/DsbD-like thiol-disulfide interchange protein
VRHIALFVVAVSVSLVAFATSYAQKSHYTDGVVGQFDDLAGEMLLEPATISAKFSPRTTDRPATLLITAKIARGRHTYSLTQPPGGPLPTTIELQSSPNFRQLSSFRSQPAPKAHMEELAPGTSIKVEEHEGQVTWYAPIELTAGVDPKTLEIRGTVHMQVCQTRGICEPVNKEFVARQAASADAANNLPAASINPPSEIQNSGSEVGAFQPKGSEVKLEGRLVPSTVRPGESAELLITAKPPANGHLYAHAARDPKIGTKPFLIAVETSSGLVPHPATTDAQPKTETSPVFGAMLYHDSPVTFKLLLDVPKNAKPGDYPISGQLGYQACEFDAGNSTCELPHAVRFSATLKVGDETSQASMPLTFSPGESYPKVAEAAAVFADNFDRDQHVEVKTSMKIERRDSRTPELRAADQYELKRVVLDTANSGSLSYYIALAFVGGLILNLMPCVLPVIGLKVMSFVEQSGKSRGHALVLNLWFAAGIVSVFLLLGLLAITLGLSWGAQFGSTTFNVAIAAIVFAMALSLLGVWEVPIPGFFGSGSVNTAAAKEGPLGAYLKGVVTTVLATPCTAPFMASAIAWAVAQTAATTLVVFAALGLGMASPYVLVGVYPELLRFLPKPGAWMETFKQISGFVLLATVIFILSYIGTLAVVPTLALLLGIAVACWLIARTPATAEFGDRVKSWAYAGTIVLVFIAISFGGLYRIAQSPTNMAWQPFSLAQLKRIAVDEGRTVLVDFSAEWCINCKVFEKTVLHTKPVEEAIARSGAVTMYGDFTKFPPEIDETIKALGANGVPVIAIFPGDAPYKPIVFPGGYSKQGLIAALDRAKSRGSKPTNNAVAESTASAAPRN